MPEPIPGTVGDVLGAAGAPIALTFRGASHPVSYPTLRVLDRAEKLVAMRASAAIAELADVLPTEELAEQKRELNSMIRSKQHGTGGKLWAEEFGQDGGMRGVLIMLWCCLEEARDGKPKESLPPPVAFDDMPLLLSESPDVFAVMGIVVPDFIRAAGTRRRLPAASLDSLQSQFGEAVAALQAARKA